MNDREVEELRALRERAYGPAADIDADAAALQRLRELEGRENAAIDRADGAVARQAVADLLQAPEAESVPPPAEVRERKARLRWSLPTVWVASVLVAVVATVLVSNLLIQRSHSTQGADTTEVASLQEDATWDVPRFFIAGRQSSDARGFEEFRGLRVIVETADDVTSLYDQCVSVITSADADASSDSAFGGQIFQGCSAGPFPAAVAFKVTDESPQQLRQAFLDGTAIQFVFDEAGGDVAVLVSAVP